MASFPQLRVGIVGVSGYAGMELVRLLANHPVFSLQLAVTDRWAGKPLGRVMVLDGPSALLPCQSQEAGLHALAGLDLLFLCTPAEASIDIAPRALAAGVRVVDLSGGFRLAEGDFPFWYGFSHSNTALLGEAIYSMPEITGGGDRLQRARLVANPGCYATAATLAVFPLLQAGLVEASSLIVDAKSGTTGTGRKGTEELSFSEVAEDLRAYRVLRHQHTPEIERTLTGAGIPDVQVVFTPHLLPVRRGILATAYARLTDAGRQGDPTAAAVQALDAFAEGKPFVQVMEPEAVTLHAVVGTNRVVIGAKADAKRGIVCIFVALDNLIKGAAGQALQNANLMFGLTETAGLLGAR